MQAEILLKKIYENMESDSLGWWLPEWFIKEQPTDYYCKPSYEEFIEALESKE